MPTTIRARRPSLRRRLACSCPRLRHEPEELAPCGDGLATRKASQRRSTPWPNRFRSSSAALPTSRVEPDRHGRAGILEAERSRADATSGSASASTPWAASSTHRPVRRLHSPYAATFPPLHRLHARLVRLAAMAELPPGVRLDHDSIAWVRRSHHETDRAGRRLRAIPIMTHLPPGDANETAAAWPAHPPRRPGPTALILTLPRKLRSSPARPRKARDGVAKGGYVLPRTLPATLPGRT